MDNYKKLSQLGTKGFTIIEVLIVMAIAGLIILIVFLSVPALQRNSRNASYRREGSQMLAAATEFLNNNAQVIPATSGSGTAGSNAATILSLAKTKNITVLTVEAAAGISTPTLTTAILRTASKCNGTAATGMGAATKQFALLFAVEDGTDTAAQQCLGT